MSLLLNACPWNSTTETPKKRIPSIKRTISNLEREYGKRDDKETTELDNTSNRPTTGYSAYDGNMIDSTNSVYNNNTPISFKEQLTGQDAKNQKITQILENMSNLKVDNEGGNLYNYTETPVSNFEQSNDMSNRVPIFQRNAIGMRQPVGIIGEGNILQRHGTSQCSISKSIIDERNHNLNGSSFGHNTPDNLANYVTYSHAYEVPKEVRPYYTQKLGMGNGKESFEEKILDKIQYLTHLMEEIQSEKTANINEEFILYTMTGVFVIYIVDAFSRSGKYIR